MSMSPRVKLVFILVALGALLLSASSVRAQVPGNTVGSVTEVGLGGFYDPLGWVPMRVSLQPPAGEPGSYILRVVQQDLDGDRVYFDRAVTLAGGGSQTFWSYFKIAPGRGGFDPQRDLRVVLADSEGRELARLPVEARPPESIHAQGPQAKPGRLLLLVGGEAGGFYNGLGELSDPNLIGIIKTNRPASLRTQDLPDRAIGYDMVDAVVWQNADPGDLLDGGGEQMSALRSYVRSGGRLIVTHQSDWQALEPIFDLLPVTPAAAVDLDNAAPLPRVSDRLLARQAEPYEGVPGPVRFVLGLPKSDSIVEAWLEPDDFEGTAKDQADALSDVSPDGRFPLMARTGYGFGCVTWLATDVSNRNLLGDRASPTGGWTAIWASLLDVGDEPQLADRDSDVARYRTNGYRDFGNSPQAGIRLAGRSSTLVTLVIVFFIAYWLLAGPGVYFWLLRTKRTHLSWYAFGLAAAGAAALTVLVTGLVLRGPAKLRHVSLLRGGSVAPSHIAADLGIYVPRDGVQTISVAQEDAPGDAVESVVTALIPPSDRDVMTGSRASPVTYVVDLSDASVIDVPYRSTLKKFEAVSGGPRRLGIEGSVALVGGERFPVGSLVNTSGLDLRNVHIAYKRPRGARSETVVLYLPSWDNGRSIRSLKDVMQDDDGRVATVSYRASGSALQPPRNRPVTGTLRIDWAPQYWYAINGVRLSLSTGQQSVFDDWASDYRVTPAVLSLFEMLPPMTNQQGTSDAVVPVNRGASEWDITAALSAGNFVVIAEADEVETPIPLTVDGAKLGGTGTVVAQFVLPIDRSGLIVEEQTTDEDGQEDVEEEAPEATS